MKKYLIRGDNIEELIENAALSLKVEVKEIKYEIIKHTKNIFGKTKEIELKVWVEKPELICDDNMTNCKVYTPEKESEEKVEIDEEKMKEDDFFEVEVLKSGIYLMLKKEVDVTKIGEYHLLQIALEKKFKNPITEEIKIAINEKQGEYVKIGEYDPSYYIDAKPKIMINRKGMEATVEVVPPIRGNHIKKESIISEIQKVGIKYGINEENIDWIVASRIYNEPIKIAEGKMPIDGDDAKIIHLFEINEKLEFKQDESGRVNYKEISNSILNANRGDIISKKIPPTAGIEGINIFGEIVPPKHGKDKFFFKGKNVEEANDGHELMSTIDGRVSVVNQMINVFPILQVDGDIDLSIGNVDFVGTVFIKGKITEGFTVKAGGDLIVDGVIENANVEVSGNLLVKNGIVGKEDGEAIIKVNGEIKTKFIQNITVEAGGKVEVSEHILNSTVSSRENVYVAGGKGRIIGGKIVATKEIVAYEVGNKFENITILEVGITPEDRSRKNEIEKLIETKEAEIEKNDVEIKTLAAHKESGTLDEKRQKIYLEKVKKQFVFAKELKDLRSEHQKLQRIFEEGNHGKIHVRNIMYPGVKFRIGENQLNIKENFKFVTFYVDRLKMEISLLPFEKDEMERKKK